MGSGIDTVFHVNNRRCCVLLAQHKIMHKYSGESSKFCIASLPILVASADQVEVNGERTHTHFDDNNVCPFSEIT